MAFIKLNDYDVYYEQHGDSPKTLVILNGIMMSTASWQPFISFLANHFSVVLVDFFDQGQSAYCEQAYTQKLQVTLVKKLLDHLQCDDVTLLGISYGGEVAMQFAMENPSDIKGLILANTTAYTNKQLKAIGDNWIHAAETQCGQKFFKATIPPIYSQSFYESRYEWLNEREKMFESAFAPKWYDGFIRLVQSAETHDVREKLSCIEAVTLVIGSDEDLITPIDHQKYLAAHIPKAHFLEIKSCGHASMYEKPKEFWSAVVGFMLTRDANFIIG